MVDKILSNPLWLKIVAGIVLYVVSAIAIFTWVLPRYLLDRKGEEFPGSVISLACGLYVVPLLMVAFVLFEIREGVINVVYQIRKDFGK